MTEPQALILSDSRDHYFSFHRYWADSLKTLLPTAQVILIDVEYARRGKAGLEDLLETLIERHRIDTIVALTAITCEIGVEFLARLRDRVYVCAYFGNAAEHFEDWFRYMAQGCDLALVDSIWEVSRFKMYQTDALYFPSGFDTALYRPLNLQRDIDVSFVGCCGKFGRSDFLHALRKAGLRVSTYGIDSPSGAVSDEQMVAIFNRSKINLNFVGIDSGLNVNRARTINNRIQQPKGRCQEVALTRSFVLSEYCEELETMFSLGSEIETFRDATELITKARQFLDDQSARDSIAACGHSRALRDFTVQGRLRKLLEEIHRRSFARPRHRAPIWVDPVFQTFLAEHQAGYAAEHACRGDIAGTLREFSQARRTGGLLAATSAFCRLAMKGLLSRYPRALRAIRKIRGAAPELVLRRRG